MPGVRARASLGQDPCGAAPYDAQARRAATMQHARVVEKTHDPQKGVQTGGLLRVPGRSGPAQPRQSDLEDVGERGLGLAASTAYAVSPPHPLTMGDRPYGGEPVGKARQPGRTACGLTLVAGAGGGGGDQEPERPQCPAVRVDPSGDPQHGPVPRTAEPADLLAKLDADGRSPRRVGDGPERGT